MDKKGHYFSLNCSEAESESNITLKYMCKVQVPKKYMNQCIELPYTTGLKTLFIHTLIFRCNNNTCTQRHIQIVQGVILCAVRLW